jgi:Phage tail-collar fibre protein
MSRILEFEITDAGLAASFNGTNTGLDAQFSHIALGSGLAGQSYVPTGTETALKSEFMRRPIAGGERIAPNEILLQALFDGNESGVIREVGLFTSTGVLWGLWSSTPIGEKTAGIPYVFAESIVIDGIDLDRVSWVAGGPSVNIIIAGPFAELSAEIIRLQRRAVQSERDRLIPIITATWAP